VCMKGSTSFYWCTHRALHNNKNNNNNWWDSDDNDNDDDDHDYEDNYDTFIHNFLCYFCCQAILNDNNDDYVNINFYVNVVVDDEPYKLLW